jgi:hypothetical protein
MPRPVPLTSGERAALVGAGDHQPNPSVRERTSASVRVADGQSALAVAH